MLRNLIHYTSSLKLTLFLILYFILFLIIVSFIPQTGIDNFNVNPVWLRFVFLFFGLHQFTHSILFILPIAAFILNLSACTIKRLVKKKKEKFSSSGRDIIHIGLLILMTGGSISFFLKHDKNLVFSEGDQHVLFNGDKIGLVSTDRLSGDGNNTENWISEFTITSGSGETHHFRLSVNNPVTYRGISLYQFDWQMKEYVYLKDSQDNIYVLEPGERIVHGDNQYQFKEISTTPYSPTYEAVFLFSREGENPVEIHLKELDDISVFAIKEIKKVKQIKINEGEDPGFAVVVVSFIVIFTGLLMITVKKILFKTGRN
ncbi:MAG: cytochrome c biogenesis protein ResB [Spirochaetales bacterium]|nr:cytochrome c biogenesis protein ResB [Spirochaetales bacterium]